MEYRRTIVVAIGASMGGPSALQKIIPALPADLPACLLVAQHMPEDFTKQLAERLDRASGLSVREAVDGMRIQEGVVLIAPGRHHMTMSSRWRVRVERAAPEETFSPSIDALFSSVARNCGSNAVGVVLTGMGKDGVKGIGMLKEANARTIAQDEVTSAIFGMPRAAIERGTIDRVVPLEEISNEIVRAVTALRAKIASRNRSEPKAHGR